MKLKKIITIMIIMLICIINLSAQSLSQTIRGTIVDKESQTALPGANIFIQNSNPTLGAMSDTFGNFKIYNVPVGRYNIRISFMGYEPFILPEILVGSGKEVVLNVELKESLIQMSEIIVETEVNKEMTLNSMSSISARSFTVEETRRYAGGFDDPARLASAFAGVSVGSFSDNAIIVRGNAPKGILWQVEGIKVPNPNHFPNGNVAGGGLMSILSSQLITKSDFFTGAFPAEYGNAISAVFDIKMRTGNNQQREHTFQAGVLGIDFATEGPFSKDSDASYLVNYRYSTLALLVPLLGEEQIPRYQDLCLKLNFPTQKYGTFSLWSISSIDGLAEPENTDSTKWETAFDRVKADMNAKMGVIGLTHKYILGKKSYFNTSVVASGFSNIMTQKRLDNNLGLKDLDQLDNTTGTFTIKSYINHKFNARHTNRTGIVLSNLFYDIDLRSSVDFIPPMQICTKEKGNSNLLEFYSQSKYNLTENLTFNLGFHSQYFMLNDNKSFEPRAGINWKISPTQTLSLGYGNHSQLEDMFVYFIQQETTNGTIRPNKNLDFTKARHLVLGYDKMMTENLRLKVEPYYQTIYNAPVIPDSSYSMLNYERDYTLNSNLENDGTGTNYGIDLTLERFLQNNFYYMLTASIFDSKYTGGDDIERNTRFNSGYVFNVLFGKEFFTGKKDKNNILGINGKFTAQGGRRISPVNTLRSLESEEIYYDESEAFSDRSPNRNYLDVSITYRKNKKNYSSVWALQIKNVLGAETGPNYEYNFITKKIAKTVRKSIIPSLSYKIEF